MELQGEFIHVLNAHLTTDLVGHLADVLSLVDQERLNFLVRELHLDLSFLPTVVISYSNVSC